MNKVAVKSLLVSVDLLEGMLLAEGQKDYGDIRDEYYDRIIGAMQNYLDSGGVVTSYRSEVQRAVVEAFSDAFYDGYAETGGEGEVEKEDDEWLTDRIGAEVANVGLLFQSLREARKEGETETLAEYHADNYARTLDAVYNQALLRGDRNKMLTFTGEDGEHTCNTCRRLNGERHRAQWWISKGLVPGQPGNSAFECGGWRCQHYLEDDDGEEYTV